MAEYVLRRLAAAVFVVWGAVTLMFVIVRLAPGDPAALMLGPTATAEQIESARRSLGLDEPVLAQYLQYLSDAARLDFGSSIRLGGDAMSHVLDRLPATVELALAATLIAVVVGLPLGMAAGRRAGGAVDRGLSAITLTLQSIPTFWFGIMLILLFARVLGALPSGGDAGLQSLILPAVTLSLPFVGIVARLVRTGLADVLREPYIQTARAKGLSERQVLWGHATRNMLVPVVTVIGLQIGALLGGAIVVEVVFSWPGLGRLIVDAVENRDYAVVQAAAVVIAAAIALINIATDLAYAALDPRIRLVAAR